MPIPFDSQVTFLYTSDPTASAAFYGDKLGLPVWLDQGSCRIYRVADGAYLGVCKAGTSEAQTTESAEKKQNVIVTLVTEDVDGWYESLRAEGVAFEKSPALNEKYQIYHCFLRDPDGYLIEIQRFLNAPSG